MREWLRDMADALLRRRSLRLDVEWLTDELDRLQLELDETQRLAERLDRRNKRLHDEVRALRLSTGAPSWDETERHDPWAGGVEPTVARIPAYIPTAEEWNAGYPVGTPVLAWPAALHDPPRRTTTRSEAWTFGHGAVVVSVEGVGGIDLDHVVPLVRPYIPLQPVATTQPTGTEEAQS
jgi:hypothetical protein